MKNLNNFPKIGAVCAKDNLRPTMANVYVDSDNTVATNGVIMVVHNRKNVFGEISDKLPEKFYIPASDWVELTKGFIKLDAETTEGFILVHCKNGSVKNVRILPVETFGNFVNYKAVIPENFDKDINVIGISPDLLLTVKNALTYDKTLNVFLKFSGSGSIVEVSILYPSNYKGYRFDGKGYIMPCMQV